ncbi:hypothetical protein COP1_014362 [Malus domestica]
MAPKAPATTSKVLTHLPKGSFLITNSESKQTLVTNADKNPSFAFDISDGEWGLVEKRQEAWSELTIDDGSGVGEAFIEDWRCGEYVISFGKSINQALFFYFILQYCKLLNILMYGLQDSNMGASVGESLLVWA